MRSPPTPRAECAWRNRRVVRLVGHAAALAVVVAGVVAVLTHPGAPSAGQALPAHTWFDEGFLELARAYQRPRQIVGVAAELLRVAVAVALITSAAARRLVAAVADRLGGRPWLAGATVAAGAVVAVDLLAFPLAFWVGYVHDGAYGMRAPGLGGWLVDWLARRAPGWLAAAGLAAGGYWLAVRSPRAWPATAGLAGAAAVAVAVTAAPLILEPLTHRTTPLAAGPVAEAVTATAAASHAEVSDIAVADASRRSPRQNAYVSGLGPTRRIVMFDTLVDGRSPQEAAMVVAHELAHDEHGDVGRATLAGAAGVVVGAYALWFLLRWRVRRGRQAGLADSGAAGLVVGVVLLAGVAATPVESAFSRRVEAAADWRALQLTDDPATFERVKVGMARANLAAPERPRLLHWWWGTHPTTAQRLTLARHYGETHP